MGCETMVKNCWGFCNKVAGDCEQYCGTGQCCRRVDYENGVDGCELARDVIGAKCGRFRGERVNRLRNEGNACIGDCDHQPGDCEYCGTGQCCRQLTVVTRVCRVVNW